MQSRFGGALVGAVGLALGVFLSGVIGLSEPTTTSYVTSAIAGFVGGYVGMMLRERRQRRS